MVSKVQVSGTSSELIHGKHVSAFPHGRIILLINRLLSLGFFPININFNHHFKYVTGKSGAFKETLGLVSQNLHVISTFGFSLGNSPLEPTYSYLCIEVPRRRSF